MSKLPKASGLPKPSSLPKPGTSIARSATNLTKLDVKKDAFAVPRPVGKVLQNARAPMSRRSKSCSDFNRQPLKPNNRPMPTAKTVRQPFKRPLLTDPEVKGKASKPNPPNVPKTNPPKVTRKSIKAAPIKKPAPYDYKARFTLLQEKHAKTVSNLTEVREEMTALEDQNEKLATEKEAISTELAQVRTEKEQIEEEFVVLKRDTDALQAKFDELEESNQVLSRVYKDLCEKHADLGVRFDEEIQTNLKVENENIREKNEILTKDLENSVNCGIELKNKIHVIESDCQELRNTIILLKKDVPSSLNHSFS